MVTMVWFKEKFTHNENSVTICSPSCPWKVRWLFVISGASLQNCVAAFAQTTGDLFENVKKKKGSIHLVRRKKPCCTDLRFHYFIRAKARWAALEMDYLWCRAKASLACLQAGCVEVSLTAANLWRPPFSHWNKHVLRCSTHVCARGQRKRRF